MYEQLKLEQQLCFPLYSLSREIIKRYTPLLNKLNLTYPQYLVMLVLWENDGQSVSAIGSKLHLDSGTLTPLLKRLQEKGLIERRRSEQDERQVHIVLSGAGHALQHQAAAVPAEIAGCLNFSTAELQLLNSIRQKLFSNSYQG